MIQDSTGNFKPIFVRDRVVGHVRGDTFCKRVRGSVHMLRVPRGWASDVSALEAARRAGAIYIEITDDESDNVYRSSISEMMARGTTFDRGFGRQVVLELDRWARPDRGEQMSLFADAPERMGTR